MKKSFEDQIFFDVTGINISRYTSNTNLITDKSELTEMFRIVWNEAINKAKEGAKIKLQKTLLTGVISGDTYTREWVVDKESITELLK